MKRIDEAISGIRIILTKQEANLEHHIYRTNLLEEAVQLLRDEVKPLSNHVDLINKMCKIFTAIAGLAATILGIVLTVQKLS